MSLFTMNSLISTKDEGVVLFSQSGSIGICRKFVLKSRHDYPESEKIAYRALVRTKKDGIIMTIRFGVIGTNFITDRFVQAGLENEEFILTAVYSRTMEKVRPLLQNMLELQFIRIWKIWFPVKMSMLFTLQARTPCMLSRRLCA